MSTRGFREVECHISQLKVGDIIKHNGKIVTVGNGHLKKCDFFGFAIYGDSYKLGTIPVIKLVYEINERDRLTQ